MSFRHMHSDVQSERLLLIVLEEPQYGGSEFRHIRATVVRRAVPHAIREGTAIESANVADWKDDYPGKCFGYRVPSHVFSKSTGTYVHNMELRGQIDICQQPLNDGKPYGNNITFNPHSVCQNTARAILDFYNKFDKFVDKYGLGRRPDDFYVALSHLAIFLKITKIVFFKTSVKHAALSEADKFEEFDLASAKVQIDSLLAQFASK